MRGLSHLRTLPAFGHSIARRPQDEVPSFLRQHMTPFRPTIVPFDDRSLSIKALEIRAATYVQISARQCAGVQLGPHSTLRRERFFKARRGLAVLGP